MLVAVRSECEFVRKFPLKYSRGHFSAKEPGNSIILTALVNVGRPSDVIDFKTANFSARVVDPCGEGVGRSRPRDCRQGSAGRGDSRLRQAHERARQHTGAYRSRAGRRRTVGGHREGGRFPRCLSENSGRRPSGC